MIVELLIASLASLLASLLLTPVVRDAFLRLRILDSPDGFRKLHQAPVPRVGGIPIAISYTASLTLLPFLNGRYAPWRDDYQLLLGVILAAGAVFLTGIVDDLLGLRPWQKLAGQLAAAALLCASGVHISSIGGHAVGLWIGIPLTLGWLILCTNAFNLIDGLDGLASGMGLLATLTIFAAALLHHSDTLALATLPLAGSLVGFLRYNFNPASVFLGDSGSLLVGFLLGSYAVIWSQKSATLLGLTVPLMALAIPLLDVCLSVARRWLRDQPIFSADRNHIHHKLLERGWTHREVVLVLYAAAGFCAVFAVVESMAPVWAAAFLIGPFCAATWLGVRHLGYLEFDGARRALRTSALRRSIRGEMAIHAAEMRIAGATSVQDCWEAVREASRQLGFSHIEASFAGREFTDRVVSGDPGAWWQLRVSLGEAGQIVVGRDLLTATAPTSLAPFVELLRRSLLPRLAAVRHREGGYTTPLDSGLLQLAENLERENRVETPSKPDAVRL